MRSLLALFAPLLLAACGLGPSRVGDACAVPEDCPERATSACIRGWPDGYCTEFACTLGSCPSGSRCVTGIEFLNVEIREFCLATCDDQRDCRDGYRCADVSLPEKVCAPLQP